MASQDNMLVQGAHHQSPGPASGADYEMVASLLQHSRGGQEVNGDSVAVNTGDLGGHFANASEDLRVGDTTPEHEHGDRQSSSQERQSDSQYAIISNPPAFGQICRSALYEAIAKSYYVLSTDICCTATAALHKLPFGGDHQMDRLSVTLAACI